MTSGDPTSEAAGQGGMPVERARLLVFSLPDDRDAVIQLLQDQLHLTPLDARVRFRHLPGLLPDVLDQAVAETAARRLGELGGKAAAVDERDVPFLDYARRLHHIRCADDGLVIVGITGEAEEVVPWTRLSLMSIGDVPLLEVRRATDVGAGSLHPSPIAPTDTIENRRYGPEIWLSCESPFRVFHIEHEAMNYEYLGERKSTSATANFSELVKDILKHTPHLFLTHSTRAYVGHGSYEDVRFDSQEEHESYVIAQILLMRQVRSETCH